MLTDRIGSSGLKIAYQLYIVPHPSLLPREVERLLPTCLYIKPTSLTRVEYSECRCSPIFRPLGSLEALQLEHRLYPFGHFAPRNPYTTTRCHIAGTGDNAFQELNDDIEARYLQQVTDIEHHKSREISSSTASTSTDQALLPGDCRTSLNDDTNINFSAFGNSSSQTVFPWPEEDLLPQSPETANDILTGLLCAHISSYTPYSLGMTDTTCLNALPGEETHLISTSMTPGILSSHHNMPSTISPNDRGSRDSSSAYPQLETLELQQICVDSAQGFSEEKFESSSTAPLMLNSPTGPSIAQHRTIAPKSGPSTPSQQIRFQCPELSCGRSFNRPTDRERHMGIHSKERKFACPEPGCGKRFYRKDKLADHSRRGHRNRKQTCTCMADRSGEAA